MRNNLKRAAKLSTSGSSKKPKKVKEQCLDKKNERVSVYKNSANPKPLLSIGKLFQGVVVRRPSQHNKSPYVADVTLEEDGTEIIAHAPMLDLGGILKPGTVVRMTKSKPGGKTSHAIQLVKVIETDQDGTSSRKTKTVNTWIGAHPGLGNAIAKALIENGHITEAILGDSKKTVEKLKAEVTMPCPDGSEKVRSDFVLNDSVVVEVKSCVCADYQKDRAPEFDKKDRYVTVISEDNDDLYKKTALFPIGKRAQNFQGQKVVSERCIKHLRHLSEIARGEYKSDGYETACLLVIVNRGDCEKFRPCREACPVFAQEFSNAISDGVRILVPKIVWDNNGDCHYGGLLPFES